MMVGRSLPSPAKRNWFTIVMIVLIVTIVYAVVIVPWRYPSSTLLYKFGLDKGLLIAGKSSGMAAGLLMVLQMILVARITPIERLISHDRLITAHRWSGILVVALAIVHPLLVFAPEDLQAIPVSMEYWQEVLGAALLLALLCIAVFTIAREFINLTHGRWKSIHRFSAPVLMAAFVVHVLFVNDGYTGGVPRYLLTGLALVFALLWIWIVLRHKFLSIPYRIISVYSSGQDAVTVEMEPLKHRVLRHAPGQFAYFRMHSAALSREEHPFTIASRPDNPAGLSVTIRCAGDWTRYIAHLKIGDSVHLQGPYGLFSPAAYPNWQHLIFIAGGVGITPMLSILRTLVEMQEQRRISVIWSNRTRDHIVHGKELSTMTDQLPNLEITHLFTRPSETAAHADALTVNRLEQLIGPFQNGKLVLLCGPKGFMKKVQTDLRKLNYRRHRVKTETFRM